MGGFTLIEVLVTVLILAVGLLGLAGLQTVSIRNNHSAYLRSQAVQLAYDIADRVRANSLVNADLTNFDTITANQNSACFTTAGCNEFQMAANDLWEWQNQVAALLPGGQAVICRDSTPDDGSGSGDGQCDSATTTSLTVKVWWNDDRATATSQRFVMSFRP
ncbi:MAG TPA: type IV pilus modification protein PilV [Sedimenticola thiotaurini]|uniref:Type IV pilus modification protein PilV n=1 Tax=Sedimenticola thiotaurini TaxID=1543721 RepID=A0A831RNE8_9GAMM|nr:type IV pilus modification protein PilV [Sedimenticola thiotaurini]